MKEKGRGAIFWTTLIVSFALLIHNGTEPLFLFAYAGIPILILWYHRTPSLWPIALYLLLIGVLGRYTRYFRESYASDTLLVTRDYIGFLLAGKNPYSEMAISVNGLSPFVYLPFGLLWYVPARVLSIDLRFFEMLVSSLVPALVFLYGYLRKNWQILPAVAVVALTPFLLDLSSDGSNDNSTIFLLLLALVLFVKARVAKSRRIAFLSAIVLGLAASFKQHVFFFLLFFVPYLLRYPKASIITSKRYLLVAGLTFILVSLPFILTGFKNRQRLVL